MAKLIKSAVSLKLLSEMMMVEIYGFTRVVEVGEFTYEYIDKDAEVVDVEVLCCATGGEHEIKEFQHEQLHA